jgi:hypothetical protein
VLSVAALRIYEKTKLEKGGIHIPALGTLNIMSTGVSRLPWIPDRPAMAEVRSPLNWKRQTFVKFYITDCDSHAEGIRHAMNVYATLRFIQTQAYGTGHKFVFLYTSPATSPLEFSMLHFPEWRRKVGDLIVRDVGVTTYFSIVTSDAPVQIQSLRRGIFMFMVWDEAFFKSAKERHLEKSIFHRLGVQIVEEFEVPLW